MRAGPPTWEVLVDWVEQGRPPGPISDYVQQDEQAAADARWIEQTVALLRHDPFPAPPSEVRARVLEAFDERYPASAPWMRRHPYLTIALATAAVVLFALLIPWLRPGEVPAVTAREVRGEVTLTTADGTTRDVRAGEALREGDLIATGKSGVVTVQFDAGAAEIQLWPESELIIEAIQSDAPGPPSATVKCESGRMRATITDRIDLVMNAWGNELRTPAGIFEVTYYEDLSTELVVEEGRVSVSNLAGRVTFDAGDEVLLWFETFPGDPLPYPLELPEDIGSESSALERVLSRRWAPLSGASR